MRASRRTRGLLIGALCGALCGALLGAAAPAGAQDAEDPYGGTTTTTTAPTIGASCELTLTSGEVGAAVTATVRGVPFGATVRILFGGSEVARGTAPMAGQAAGGAVLLGGPALPAQAASTTIQVSFTVPDVAPGSYLVTAVGADFTCRCSPETGGHFDVLGEQLQGSGGGSLPRTGMYLGLLAALGLALVATGRALQRRGRAG